LPYINDLTLSIIIYNIDLYADDSILQKGSNIEALQHSIQKVLV